MSMIIDYIVKKTLNEMNFKNQSTVWTLRFIVWAASVTVRTIFVDDQDGELAGSSKAVRSQCFVAFWRERVYRYCGINSVSLYGCNN